MTFILKGPRVTSQKMGGNASLIKTAARWHSPEAEPRNPEVLLGSRPSSRLADSVLLATTGW